MHSTMVNHHVSPPFPEYVNIFFSSNHLQQSSRKWGIYEKHSVKSYVVYSEISMVAKMVVSGYSRPTWCLMVVRN